MIHKHQFIKTGTMTKPKGAATPANLTHYRDIEGAVVVCLDPDCGEVRHVWSDGVVDIAKQGLPDTEE